MIEIALMLVMTIIGFIGGFFVGLEVKKDIEKSNTKLEQEKIQC